MEMAHYGRKTTILKMQTILNNAMTHMIYRDNRSTYLASSQVKQTIVNNYNDVCGHI